MLLCFLITVGIVLLDQLTKLWVLDALKPIGTYPIWEKVFHFTYVENTGAAFGMLSDQRWVFMIISAAAILGLVIYMLVAKTMSRLEVIALSFIIGGGIGNMIDRVFRGFVVDFIDVRCINFYVFNIADSFVCVGCALMILALILTEVRAAKEKKNAAGA